jgi:hypothetical protein
VLKYKDFKAFQPIGARGGVFFQSVQLSLKHFLSSLSGLIRKLTAVSEVLLSTVACAAMRVTAALSRPSGRNSEEEEEINVYIRGADAAGGIWARWRAVVAALAGFHGEAVKEEGCTDQICVRFLSMPYLHNTVYSSSCGNQRVGP